MKFKSLTSTALNEDKVVAEFCSSLSTHHLACLICYCTEEYDASALQQELVKRFNNVPIHGCTTCQGVMTEKGFQKGPVVGLLAVYDSGINAYGTGIGEFGESISDTVSHVIDMALLSADRVGEVPDLILMHSTPGDEEKVLNALDQKFGTQVPLIGGSAADNMVSKSWSVFTEQKCSSNALSITVFFASQAIYSSFSAGHAPTKFSGIASKVNQRVLLEIDDKPATQVYHAWTNEHIKDDNNTFLFERATVYPLGRHVGTDHTQPYFKLSHPIRETDNNGIELFTDLSEGDTVYLMAGCKDQLISRAAHVIKSSYYEGVEVEEKLGAINIFCAGPMLYLKQDMQDVCDKINIALEGQPFISPFTFGEQGRLCGGESAHGNLMVSSATFYRLKA
ncbi:histidine kinase [Vibrio sp. T187]|uniref:FIST signal transduction protein n=1 Tax=Vibrio TaxID=662 RepID=UPI0010C981AD|nr:MULTISPECIES: FIST N-terminal domain-containing protein [Vibrio]MBW3697884.1 histidine kinase [Vibrio sp. T187]